jgi:type I restriction enzyme S subunit
VIAAFLDRKTAQIDALVGKKQRLIGRLQEKRQALISHTVTKGLNPHAPMKDSGIEWLGEIPQHWEVKRLKHISPRIGVGLVINPSTYTTDEGVPFLFGGDIQPGKILTEKARRMTDENSRKLPQSRLHAGDLVTVRVGYPGVTAVVPPELEGANCASVMVVRGASAFVSQWLCYAINSPLGSDQINVVKYGAAQEQFNIGHAVEFVFPVPPRSQTTLTNSWTESAGSRVG